jgi:hypothetical protein
MRKRLIRVVVALVLMFLAAVGIVGCDNRPCLKGHYDFMPVTHVVGKSTTVTMQPVWHCDQYGKKKP